MYEDLRQIYILSHCIKRYFPFSVLAQKVSFTLQI